MVLAHLALASRSPFFQSQMMMQWNSSIPTETKLFPSAETQERDAEIWRQRQAQRKTGQGRVQTMLACETEKLCQVGSADILLAC